ncbi:hypothetical protein [Stutzerimonas xanthomarina]|uniref:hypothetical protein n=1 Tax=Stutzerimonas xanthomarina TaxID=271420 RepID=UPI003AA93E45
MSNLTQMQHDLFAPTNVAAMACMPLAPKLIAHSWPYPSLSGEDSARSSLSQSAHFVEVIAMTIKRANAKVMTDAEVKALLPVDWLHALGRWAHATLAQWQGEQHGIHVEYVSHGDGGHHWQYRVAPEGAE